MPKPNTTAIMCISTIPLTGAERIEYINYDMDDSPSELTKMAKLMKNDYDEVYLVKLHPYMTDFIKEIRRYGKRL